MDWRLELTRRAERDLTWLARSERDAIRRSLDRLLNGFESGSLAKLPGFAPRWWLTVNDQRVAIRLDYKNRSVVVLCIVRAEPTIGQFGVGGLGQRSRWPR